MASAADAAALTALGTRTYVLLTTFRRDGTPVPTPVWPVADTTASGGRDGQLLVTTGADSGKVKRLRHTPRVLLSPCDARGRTAPGAVQLEAVAEVAADPAVYRRAHRLLVPQHPVLARAVALARRAAGAAARLRGRPPVREVTLVVRPAHS